MEFMPYADDTVWLLFGLGLAIVTSVVVIYIAFGLFGWASVGFLTMGSLMAASYYIVGMHPPIVALEAEAAGTFPPADNKPKAEVTEAVETSSLGVPPGNQPRDSKRVDHGQGAHQPDQIKSGACLSEGGAQ